MRHYLGSLCTMLALVMLQGGLFGQVSKDEKKFWKNKAKMYVKNPIALKAEFENYQDQIKDLKKRNKEMQTKLSEGAGSDQADSLRWALIQMEGELQAARTQNEKLKQALKTQKTAGDQGIKPGLIYRVQIGAYVFHEMDAPPSASIAPEFVAERADGFNKYMIGQFRTYEESEQFRDGMRELGIKDAWIVPYVDGIRVSIEEARRYAQQQGTTMNN